MHKMAFSLHIALHASQTVKTWLALYTLTGPSNREIHFLVIFIHFVVHLVLLGK